jgi:hypothetical protein
MTNFDLSGIPDAPPPPPIDPMVAREEKIADDTRVESELNRFIAAKQDALFEAPDAYYRRQGIDAVDGVPQAIEHLHDIKHALLDGLANDYQRKKLGAALDAQMTLAGDDVARHAAEQSKAWQRQVALDRIDLLAKEAAFHHSDDDLVDVLGVAAANAARAHASVGDGSGDADRENAAAHTARSRILSAAIQARLNNGNATGAAGLFDRTKDSLDPEHAAPLVAQLQPTTQPHDPEGTASILVSPILIREGDDGSTSTEPPQNENAGVPEPQPEAAPPEAPQPEEPQGREEKRRLSDVVVGHAISSAVDLPARQLASVIGAPTLRVAAPNLGIAGELAGSASRLAPFVKGGGLLTAAGILLWPWNSQGRTMDLGGDLRARWAPGERLIKIEKRTDNGFFGTGVGATWEELPVEATFEPDEHGRQILRVDAGALKRALAAPPKTRTAETSSPAPFEALPASKPVIYEIRIGASVDGGKRVGFREATHEEIERLCPNYPLIQAVGLRAAAEIEGMGARRGRMVHKLAENQLNELKVARSAELLRDMGIVELRPEIALRNGVDLSFYRAKGSSVLDVLEVYGKGDEKRACVYDFKTGTAVLPDATAIRYAHEVGNYVREKYKVMPIHITVVPVHLP